ncbi:HNH endonuclease [Sandarakinorhabdus oryzae]|uniref:HNH endonuclease n=1 Tax=Sandarakinorhabdus oryzae TaxID=2675220 RepID=UPI0012E1CFFC|nr:HNH endonuclease [Sandarakinorhabdus oryzae]
MAENDAAPHPCWLCGRVLGSMVEWHHPVPKAKGGRQLVPVHPICHEAIHAHFSNSQLGRMGADKAALLAEPGLAAFVAWVAGKPPDFHAPTKGKKR